MIEYEEKDQNPQSTKTPPKIKFGSGFHSFQCFTHEQVKEIIVHNVLLYHNLLMLSCHTD